MNYFAHGLRFTDRPYFLAGTALPDWLSVVDRSVRLRARHVTPFAGETSEPAAELAAGVLQHLEDDGWFHRTAAFTIATARLTVLFRDALPPDDGHRPAFLGHIVTEMLLDSVLIERDPSRLQQYYDAFAGIDPDLVETLVNQMSPRATTNLRAFIPLFVSEGFLHDYADSQRLLRRLNQVMRRVGLNLLPASFATVLGTARGIVTDHAPGLLAGWTAPPV